MNRPRLPRAAAATFVIVLLALLGACGGPGGGANAAPPAQAAPTSPSGASRIAPLPRISRGLPAFGSPGSGDASAANDDDYATSWRSVAAPSAAAPAWLAYDLTAVPAAQRRDVILALYNDGTGAYYQPDAKGAFYSQPRDYTVEANAAPGGATAPTSGWVTLLSVTENAYSGRTHRLHLAGFNWVQVRFTAANGAAPNNDISVNLDLHDAAVGGQDHWLFLGDSITMEGFHRLNIDGSAWAGGGYARLVNAARPDHFPLVLNGGVGGTTLQWAYANREPLLRHFDGQYVAIAYGTNDANFDAPLSQADVDAWYANLLGLADYVIGQGKTPVVGTIPWGNASRHLAQNAQTLNGRIEQLYLDRPAVVRGPDLYTFFSTHQQLIRDGLHPSFSHDAPAQMQDGLVGYEWLQRQWRDAMLANAYGAAAGTPATPPASTPTPPAAPIPTAPATPTPATGVPPTPPPAPTAGGDGAPLVLYDNGFRNGFSDGSFSAVAQNPCDGASYVSAPCSYAFAPDAWGALSLRHAGVGTAPYARFEFAMRPGDQPLGNYAVAFYDAQGKGLGEVGLSEALAVATLPDGWVRVSVPLGQLNPGAAPVAEINIVSTRATPLGQINVDDIRLVGP